MQQQAEGSAPSKRRESSGEGFMSRVKGWFQGNL